jgi:hypothetical protein
LGGTVRTRPTAAANDEEQSKRHRRMTSTKNKLKRSKRRQAPSLLQKDGDEQLHPYPLTSYFTMSSSSSPEECNKVRQTIKNQMTNRTQRSQHYQTY